MTADAIPSHLDSIISGFILTGNIAPLLARSSPLLGCLLNTITYLDLLLAWRNLRRSTAINDWGHYRQTVLDVSYAIFKLLLELLDDFAIGVDILSNRDRRLLSKLLVPTVHS